MGFNWSEEQQKVIDLRNRDILVSAAAGSGKTAVLVERIIQRITDRPGINIDELLVVTFTKAAAGEMKERISKKLNEMLEADPTDRNLMYQSAIVPHAMITTIDSFCLFVVRNYFDEIGLEPGFRVADETEVALLEKDMIDRVFERAYRSDDNEAFLRLVDQYSGKRNDSAVRDMVEKIYHTSLSAPWPREWMERLKTDKSDFADNLQEHPVFRYVVETAGAHIQSALENARYCLELANDPTGPNGYAQSIADDIKVLETASELKTYEAFYEFFQNYKPGTIGRIVKYSGDVAKKDAVSDIRKKYNKLLKEDIGERFFKNPWDEVEHQMERMGWATGELVRLSLELADEMSREKRKRRMLDFSDMEHFALEILVDSGTKQPRAAAIDLQKHFKEIMIDEYQDSNDVQEAILSAISGNADGRYNMFMVGDVKQSIYRFRMANPKLFLGKYKSYSPKDSEHQRIDLSQNFRSRAGVLDFCNDIFFDLMEESLGGIDYDEAAALHPKAVYPESEEPNVEIMLLDPKVEPGDGNPSDEIAELDKTTMEARMIAHRIQEMVGTVPVRADDTSLRPAQYSDIVILLRSIKTFGPVLQAVLTEYGIPVHVDSTTGYFSAQEVNMVLNLLMLVDNPLQDIPMASILKSPIVGLSENELAQIRTEYPAGEYSFAEACLEKMKALEAEQEAWTDVGQDAAGRLETCQEEFSDLLKFWRLLKQLRRRKDLSVHEMIQYIFDETGYDSYVTALPGGAVRAANLSMLVEKAIAYEGTSYKGVFHFLRYIHQMKKYEKDFGEADVEGENGNVVHIKTIHKSKGLEYPIVFVSGLATEFNKQDEKSPLIVHPDFGLGLVELSGTPRRRKSSLLRDAIVNYLHTEALGEELRVLYVALTRAKEKLVLTGLYTPKNESHSGRFGFSRKVMAKSYMDWIAPLLPTMDRDKFVLREIDAEYLVQRELADVRGSRESFEERMELIESADDALVQKIRQAFCYEYPYAAELNQKSKYSVSEIKHHSMELRYEEREGETEKPAFLKAEHDSYIPSFLSAKRTEMSGDGGAGEADKETDRSGGKVSEGAVFGSAVHRVMELLDFAEFASVDSQNKEAVFSFAEQEYLRMCRSGELEEMYAGRVHSRDIVAFLESPVAGRMAEAAARGELYREKPFVMEHGGYLVQGIIDVFWKEADGVVLLDYKTDHVKTGDELVLRYAEQLALYRDALERLYGNVKASMIYSFRLREEIVL